MSSITTSAGYEYARNVLGKRVLSNEKVRMACERFMMELAESEKDHYPYRFDFEAAMRPIGFMEKFLVPTKGNYTKFTLLPWQKFFEMNLYGWLAKDTGYRRFREGFVAVPRANGKTTLLGGNGIYGSSKDGERGADIYLMANSKKQAARMYGECKKMIESSPVLAKRFRTLSDAIYYDPTYSTITSLSNDGANLQGLNAHMAVFDEVSEYESFEAINAIRRSFGKRMQPLLIFISAMGSVLDGPMMQYYQQADQVLKTALNPGGADAVMNPIVAESIFALVYELDQQDDIEDYTLWGKANPSLGTLLNLKDLRVEWERAKLIPQERGEFICRQLNIFANAQDAPFIDYEVLKKNLGSIDERALAGQVCYGGFDLSATEDFTSACLLFPLDDGRFYILSHTWVPEDKVNKGNENLDFAHLQMLNLLTICPGSHVDQESVLEWFTEARDRYDIVSIGYDPANAPFFVRRLKAEGLTTNVVRNGPITLNGPMKAVREFFLDGRIVFNNNPLYFWYINNVRLRRDFYDKQKDNWMPTKANRFRKIDGFMASLFAFTEYIRTHTVFDDDREADIRAYKLF